MGKTFDIFLSYRRAGGGFETANLLHNRLTNAGYKVFMDVENLRSGKFNDQLYNQIDACKDFIVVLGPDSLERCVNEDDWVRLEVAHAIKNNKNIIPIFLRGFTHPKEKLPEDIAELLNYEGLEASTQLFDAFLEKLKGMLVSNSHLNWQRIKKPLLIVALPILFLIALLSYFYINKQNKEQIQVEQVCTQVISEISAGFIQGNDLIGIIQDANTRWKDFSNELQKAENEQEKLRLKKDFNQFLDFNIDQVEKTMQLPAMTITQSQEELLTKNSISVQDIKAARPMFLSDIEETKNYLVRMKYWLNTPEMGWPDGLDKAFDYLASMNVEMINTGLYAFNELMIEMPEKSQKIFFKFQPSYTNFTAKVDFNAQKEQLEAEQEKCRRRCELLLGDYSTIIGDENMKVEKMKNHLDSLKGEKKKLDNQVNHKLDSLKKVARKYYKLKIDSAKKVIEKKKTDLALKQTEVDVKKKKLRESYQRIQQKCTFDKTEESGMMWGKIIFLARFAHNQILTENDYKAQNERLRQEAINNGQNPNLLEPIKSEVSSKEIFQEVQKRLDLYLQLNKSSDPNTSIYIPAAKNYYKLVAEQKLEPIGVLVIGTKDNITHPLLKTGDIVVSRKGEPVINNDIYFALSKNEGVNTQTFIRFINGKMTTVTGIVPGDCKVLVGVVNLWGEK